MQALPLELRIKQDIQLPPHPSPTSRLRNTHTMASTLKSALPAHLKHSKPSGLGGDAANTEFARKHHGKTQSHMVSESLSALVCRVPSPRRCGFCNTKVRAVSTTSSRASMVRPSRQLVPWRYLSRKQR
jgi:hypothetical protein